MLLAALASLAVSYGLSTLTAHVPLALRGFVPETALQVVIFAYLLTYLDISYKRSGYKSRYFQTLGMWKRVVDYFPGKITVQEPLDHEKQYIFAAFPHGACTVQHLLTMTNGAGMLSSVHRGDRRDLAASVLFLIPFVRELLLLLGNVDAGKLTARHNLKENRSLLIFVGGEAEQLLTEEGKHKVFLRKRKGFIKLALQFGTPLVPIYTFGENDMYSVSKFLFGFRNWLQKYFHIGLPVVWGRWFSLCPYQVPLELCIGAPIPVEKHDRVNITDEKIDKLHSLFCEKLNELFEANKARCGQPNAKLEIL